MSRISPLTTAYQTLLSKGRLKASQGQAALVFQLSNLQERLIFNTPNKATHSNGIYIYGGVGTGKSHLADLFTSTLPNSVSRRRAHFFEFMTDTHMRLHQARAQSNYKGDALVQIGRDLHAESRVLCLDEFQVSDIADAMILKRLFTSFWDSGGIMVSTSNRHPNDLYKDGLNRPLFMPFIAEIQRRCIAFEMQGTHDYRMDSKHSGWRDVFFTDARAFDTSLAEALGRAELEPYRVDVVTNRSFEVDAAYAGGGTGQRVVVSSFATLCEASLGAADYHALCAQARTIYLRGLRAFEADEVDVVRRFIVLVDVAYESRTRVVCLSTNSLLETFANIMDQMSLKALSSAVEKTDRNLSVRKGGGSSSSMMSTYMGEMEWSATGLKGVSLATGGAGEKDVRFAIGRAISRLTEMGSPAFGVQD